MTSVAKPSDIGFIVEPARRWPRPGLGELVRHRELVYFLSWRNVKLRYKQTFFGVAWAIVQPLLTMAIFTVVFGRLVGVPTGGVPYPLFALAGVIPWTYFANAVNLGTQSLTANPALLTRVYLPRIALPLSACLTWLLDLAIAQVLLGVMLAGYGIAPPVGALLLPLVAVHLVVVAAGTSVWLSAINVRYRDVGQVLPYLIQLLLFLTPVAYPAELLSGGLRYVYALNPMVGVVEMWRWALLGVGEPLPYAAISAVVGVVGLAAGWIFFARTEQTFADVV